MQDTNATGPLSATQLIYLLLGVLLLAAVGRFSDVDAKWGMVLVSVVAAAYTVAVPLRGWLRKQRVEEDFRAKMLKALAGRDFEDLMKSSGFEIHADASDHFFVVDPNSNTELGRFNSLAEAELWIAESIPP